MTYKIMQEVEVVLDSSPLLSYGPLTAASYPASHIYKEKSALTLKNTSSPKNSSFSQDICQYGLKYLIFESIYIPVILWSKKPLKIKQKDTFMVDNRTYG